METLDLALLVGGLLAVMTGRVADTTDLEVGRGILGMSRLASSAGGEE